MRPSKPCFDVGLATGNLAPMLGFWQHEIGLPFDRKLPIVKDLDQYRHDAMGSVLKINHYHAPLPRTAPSGYREILIARPGMPHTQTMTENG